MFEQLMPWIVSRCIQDYCCIYVNNNSTAQSIPNGTDCTDLIVPNADVLTSKNISINESTGEMTILKNGIYSVLLNFSSRLSVNNIVLDTVLFKNGVEVPNIHMKRQFASALLMSHGSIDGIVLCEKGDKLKVVVKHNNASAVNVTVQYGTFSIHKI